MPDRVIFNLKKMWPMPDGKIVNLWDEIKSGRKTIEYRDATAFWAKRLLGDSWYGSPTHLTDRLKVHKAWFVVGYPKNNLPRLEADIISLKGQSLSMQFEIGFTNIREVTSNNPKGMQQ